MPHRLAEDPAELIAPDGSVRGHVALPGADVCQLLGVGELPLEAVEIRLRRCFVLVQAAGLSRTVGAAERLSRSRAGRSGPPLHALYFSARS